MPDPVFEKYEPVLFNIEMALIGIYRRDEEMTDFEAEQATTALIRSYQAEQRKRGAPQLRLNDLGQKAYDAVRQVCEWHLGRRDDQPELEAVAPFRESGAISVLEVVTCLKRIRRSIQMWHKDYGRRGYFDYVSQFLS